MRIELMVNGVLHSIRSYDSVPRKGDKVWVYKGRSNIIQDGWMEVKEVYWSDKEDYPVALDLTQPGT